MKTIPNSKCPRGLTLIDTLVAIATVSLVVLVVLPALSRSHRGHGPRIRCVNNLRQMGVACRLWANDNNDHFPWNATNLADRVLEPYAYLLLMTNELNSPKILLCPEDSGRSHAVVFDQTFSNNNVSYFLGLEAEETKPQTILSGDRNLGTNNTILSGLVKLQAGTKVSWAPGLHSPAGNIGLGDGSAQQVGPRFVLPTFSDDSTGSTERLLIP